MVIVIGVLLWLVNTYIPMDGKIKSILNAVVVAQHGVIVVSGVAITPPKPCSNTPAPISSRITTPVSVALKR